MAVPGFASATPLGFARVSVVTVQDTTWNDPLFGAFVNPEIPETEPAGRLAGVNVPV
jgi:hypothetical protein